MSFIAKPRISHPKLPRNKLGLTARDYEGGISTLCAGCGHDSITAAIIQAVFELGIEPHMLGKMSGIGCSSKTPAYFVSQSHGFNAVHGRMASVTTGANAANRDLTYIGVSGDGDSLSIGMGQFAHVIRRNLDMCYIIENNGVYGLTKGQYSASADIGSRAKKAAPNRQMPIDPVSTAIGLGASYIARGFSGDKQQLVPLIKGALMHKGFSLLDIISPCVTFNDNESISIPSSLSISLRQAKRSTPPIMKVNRCRSSYMTAAGSYSASLTKTTIRPAGPRHSLSCATASTRVRSLRDFYILTREWATCMRTLAPLQHRSRDCPMAR